MIPRALAAVLLAFALLPLLGSTVAVQEIPVSGEGIIVAVGGYSDALGGYVSHVYIYEEKCVRILVSHKPVSVGDYVSYSGYLKTTYTLLMDPITHRYVPIGYFVFNASVSALYKAVYVKIDRGCGSTYYLGEEARVYFHVPITARVRLSVQKPGVVSVIIDRVLESGTYVLRGTVGAPPGPRTLVLEVWFPVQDCPLYDEYIVARVTCGYRAVSLVDLVIKSVEIPSQLVECGDGVAYVVVANEGRSTSGETRVIAKIGDAVVGSAVVPPIAGGGQVRVKVNLDIPCCPSTSDIAFIVDPDDRVSEVNENNNVYTVRGVVKARSPQIRASLSPSKLEAGSEVQARISICNVGNASAKSVSITMQPEGAISISPTTLNLGEIKPDSSLVASVKIKALEAGSAAVKLTITYVDECGRRGSASIRLPLEVVKRKLKLSVSASSPTVKVFEKVTISGHAPPEASGLRLAVVLRRDGGNWTTIGWVSVGPNGEFAFTYTPKSSGKYEVGVRYPGDKVWSSGEAYTGFVAEKIRPRLVLNATGEARLGLEVEVVGRLSPPRNAVAYVNITPPSGNSTLVKVNVTNGTFRTRVRLDKAGEWRVRAVVPGNEAYEAAEAALVVVVKSARRPVTAAPVVGAVATGAAIGVASVLEPARAILDRFTQSLCGVGRRAGVAVRPPFLTMGEVLSALLALAFMFAALVLVCSGGLTFTPLGIAFIAPQALIAAAAAVFIDQLSEALILKLRGVDARYSVSPSGAASLLITAAAFGAPLASPGRTLYPRQVPLIERARVAVYKFLVLTVAAGVFALVKSLGATTLGDLGLVASLSILLYSLLPVPGLLGYDLARRAKLFWAGAFAVSAAMYVTCMLWPSNIRIFEAAAMVAAELLVVDAILLARKKEGLAGVAVGAERLV